MEFVCRFDAGITTVVTILLNLWTFYMMIHWTPQKNTTQKLRGPKEFVMLVSEVINNLLVKKRKHSQLLTATSYCSISQRWSGKKDVKFQLISNQKVLLRDRKRHTARCVACSGGCGQTDRQTPVKTLPSRILRNAGGKYCLQYMYHKPTYFFCFVNL